MIQPYSDIAMQADELGGIEGFWRWNIHVVEEDECLAFTIHDLESESGTGDMALLDLKSMSFDQLTDIHAQCQRELEECPAFIRTDIEECAAGWDADQRNAEAKEHPA